MSVLRWHINIHPTLHSPLYPLPPPHRPPYPLPLTRNRPLWIFTFHSLRAPISIHNTSVQARDALLKKLESLLQKLTHRVVYAQTEEGQFLCDFLSTEAPVLPQYKWPPRSGWRNCTTPIWNTTWLYLSAVLCSTWSSSGGKLKTTGELNTIWSEMFGSSKISRRTDD